MPADPRRTAVLCMGCLEEGEEERSATGDLSVLLFFFLGAVEDRQRRRIFLAEYWQPWAEKIKGKRDA